MPPVLIAVSLFEVFASQARYQLNDIRDLVALPMLFSGGMFGR
jgi:hypothetical protein